MNNRKELNYEKYIQYLYKIIENLESQKEIDIIELQNLKKRLKNSEKLCEEKEKFILFREQQLSHIYEETENKINRLKYRIQKLREMSSSSSSVSNTNTSVKELLNQVWENFKYLIDIYLNPDIGGLLEDEITDLRDKTKVKFTQIEDKYFHEIARLRAGIIEENENMLFVQQQTINEQRDNITELVEQVKRYQEDINKLIELKEKNEALQDDLGAYRTENQHLTESLAGAQKEILDIQQDFEEQSEAYVEVSEAFIELETINDELKEQIIIGNN